MFRNNTVLRSETNVKRITKIDPNIQREISSIFSTFLFLVSVSIPVIILDSCVHKRYIF